MSLRKELQLVSVEQVEEAVEDISQRWRRSDDERSASNRRISHEYYPLATLAILVRNLLESRGLSEEEVRAASTGANLALSSLIKIAEEQEIDPTAIPNPDDA